MAEDERPRLVLFPGLGADRRLFGPQMALPTEIEVPEWIAPAGRHEPLHEYAGRIAKTIRAEAPFWLGGVSFGGMLAMEVARHVRCRGVFLISSCRSCRSLPAVSRMARPIARWVPPRLSHVGKSLTCPVRLLFGASTREQVVLFHDMLRNTPPAFLHWSMCQALGWPGAGDLGVPVHQIHGSRDRVIRCPEFGNCEVVPGAGHLMNLTHAEVVNRFVTDRMTGSPEKAVA